MWWLWIVVAMVLIAGPIFWARPSPRERRLAALRSDALSLGLKISTEIVDPWTADRLKQAKISNYRLITISHGPRFRLWRFPGRDTWTPTPQTIGLSGREGPVWAWIQDLPESIRSVQVSETGLSVTIDEDIPGLTASEIHQHLQALKALVQASADAD
ncbi:MAG: hypothetical protein EBS77_01185 [Gammaproteobacteria bacterium]|nr:hypothetical protein [Gammaproteobacteria bacterium]